MYGYFKPIRRKLSVGSIDIPSKDNRIFFSFFWFSNTLQKPLSLLTGGRIKLGCLVSMKIALKVLVFPPEKFFLALTKLKNLSLNCLLAFMSDSFNITLS